MCLVLPKWLIYVELQILHEYTGQWDSDWISFFRLKKCTKCYLNKTTFVYLNKSCCTKFGLSKQLNTVSYRIDLCIISANYL